MPDLPLAAAFPTRGLDVAHAYGAQPAGTTPVAKNVRVCEPSTLRMRGGSRPGTLKYIAGQVPEGKEPFQELNSVVIAAADAIDTGIDDPGAITVEDPSSDGPPSSWGSGDLGFDDPYTGDGMTGETEQTRNPYGPDGARSKRRDKGSGFQPNKNVVSGAPGGITVGHKCFQGSLTIEITKPAPDPFLWTGQKPTFFGVLCAPYVAGNPVYHGPQTALVVKRDSTDVDSAEGTFLPDHIAHWLWRVVGTDASGVVIADFISAPGAAECTEGVTCSGAPPPSVSGTGTGGIINAQAP